MRDNYVNLRVLIAAALWVGAFTLMGSTAYLLAVGHIGVLWLTWVCTLAGMMAILAALLHVRCMASRMCRLIRVVNGYGAGDDPESGSLRIVP